MASVGDDCIFTSSDGTKSTKSSSKNTNGSSLADLEISDVIYILPHNGKMDQEITDHDADDVMSHSESPSTKFRHCTFSEFESSGSAPTLSEAKPFTPSISLNYQISTTTTHSSMGTSTPVSRRSSLSLNYQVSLEIIDEKKNGYSDLPDLPAKSNSQMSDVFFCGQNENENLTYDPTLHVKQQIQSHKILPIHEHLENIDEWSIKILTFDVSRVEIGVVSVKEENSKHQNSQGIKYPQNYGARAVYGMDRTDDTAYYASYNSDGSVRCFKRLSKTVRWKKGDILKILINYDMWNIKFYLNNKRVRKALSLESKKNRRYYPIIAMFSGYCDVKLMPKWIEV